MVTLSLNAFTDSTIIGRRLLERWLQIEVAASGHPSVSDAMEWPTLLFGAAFVLCPVFGDETVSDRSHGPFDLSQLHSLQHGSPDLLNGYFHSTYASQFGKFEPADSKEKEVHHNVKTIIVTKKVPVPYTVQVERKVPYAVKVPVRRPYAIFVPKPYLVEIPKPVPYAIKVPVPQPFAVEKHVPVPYRVPVDKPFPIQVPKPYPVILERKIPVTVEKPVPYQVKVPVEKPVPVPVAVEKHIPYTVEKPVPVPVRRPDDKTPGFEKPFTFSFDHQSPYPGQFDSNADTAQAPPTYYAEFFQKQHGDQNHLNQIAAEQQLKEFQPSPEEPDSTVGIGQQSKVISFLPGSPSQEQISYYYPGTAPQDDAHSSSSSPKAHKISASPPLNFQWPKPVGGDWTPKSPSYTAYTTQKPIPSTTYSIGDGKTVFKFSLERNPDTIQHASHTLFTESLGPQNKPAQQKFYYNQLMDSSIKSEKYNKKKNIVSDKLVTSPEAIKSVYLDFTKQKTPYINFDISNSQISSSQQNYPFFDSSYDKYEFKKPPSISSNHNLPKLSSHQMTEHLDFSKAQPLIQTQSTTQTPYFHSLQQLHSYNPFYQNISSYQLGQKSQSLNPNIFSLSQYPNVYSNKHTGYSYIFADSIKGHESKDSEKSQHKDVKKVYSRTVEPFLVNEAEKNRVTERQEEKKESITYPTILLVTSEQPDANYQTQLTTPKEQYYEIDLKTTSESERSPSVRQTTSRPANELNIQLSHGDHSSEQLNEYKQEAQPVQPDDREHGSHTATRVDSIFGGRASTREEKTKEKRKDKRRSGSTRNHKNSHKSGISSARTLTTPSTYPSLQTVESQDTLTGGSNSKPQVPNPLDNQLLQTTAQPQQISRVEFTKTFANKLPVRMAYSITADNSRSRNPGWKKPDPTNNPETNTEKESKRKESSRRRIIRKQESHVASATASTTASTIRTRGTRRYNRHRTDNNKIESTSRTGDSSAESTSSKIDESSFGGDTMKVIQTSSKVEHSKGHLEPNSTAATSFTDITRSFPRKSRRRGSKRHSATAHNSTVTTTLAATSNYPSTANYPPTVSHYFTTPVTIHTSEQSSPSTVNNTSNSNYPSTSNYPLTNKPTPFQLTSPQSPVSIMISSTSMAQPTPSPEENAILR